MESNNKNAILQKAGEILNEPDAIIDFYDQTFFWVSEKIAKLTGFPVDTIIGVQVSKVHGETEESIREFQTQIMNTPDGIVNTYTIKTKMEIWLS